MISYSITITAIEPLVLRQGMGSETRSDTVDFISGNKILGILAGNCYRKLSEDQNDDILLALFHDSTVRYGNAYPLHKGKVCYPVPASLKLQDGRYTYTPTEGFKKNKAKDGYIYEDANGKLRLVKVSKGERLKSARDSKTRGSKDEAIYLYGFVKRGTQFKGQIQIFEDGFEKREILISYIEKLKGIHYLGTSKGEFGRSHIELEKDIIAEDDEQNPNLEIKVYAFTDLVFLNMFGAYTTRPSAKMLGFEQAKIDYVKSSITFEQIQFYNGKRQAPDASRLAIKRGSVFVLKGNHMTWDPQILKSGVGIHQQEGFGQVLLNPGFLEESRVFEDTMSFVQQVEITLGQLVSEDSKETDKYDIIAFEKILQARHELAEKEAESYKKAEDFIKKNELVFKSMTKNQWGAVRQKATLAIRAAQPKEILLDYLLTGKDALLRDRANQNWKGKALKTFKEFLENKDSTVEDVLKISVEMPKRNN